MGSGAMETAAPATADMRAGPYRGGLPAETRVLRTRRPFCLIGTGSDSYRARCAERPCGPSGAHAPLSQQAHVPGRCLSGSTFGNPRDRTGRHARLRLSHLSAAWQQSHPRADARSKCGKHANGSGNVRSTSRTRLGRRGRPAGSRRAACRSSRESGKGCSGVDGLTIPEASILGAGIRTSPAALGQSDGLGVFRPSASVDAPGWIAWKSDVYSK